MIRSVEVLPFNAGNAATVGVWRVRRAGGTAILKIVRPPGDTFIGSPQWQTSDRPTHWNYWQRELLAYQSGLCAGAYADAGIAGPPMLGVDDLPNGQRALWLADCAGIPASRWTLDQFAGFANQLGLGQAAYTRKRPDLPWLSRGWLGQYLADRDVDAAPDWDQPATAIWPATVKNTLRGLWERRQDIVAVAASLPRTLCHLDVWPMNMFLDDGRWVLVDWGFVGEGAIGEDISNLIVDTITDGMFPASMLDDLASASIESYTAGLRAGGWHGDEATVRRGVAATGAAKYAWLAPAMVRAARRDVRLGAEQYGLARSPEEVFEHRQGLLAMLASWARSLC